MHSNPSDPIGIFDSGIGGLTVVQAIRERLPHELLCYFGDTARVPYGTKSSETIIRYSCEITQFLKSHHVKMIVVACNTASSVALPYIQRLFEGPVIGVVEPGVRAALSKSRSGRIGVIGTKSTIQSEAYQKRLLELDPSIHVAARSCPLFVPLAEEGWVDDPVTLQIAQRYLTSFQEENIDTVILGCTHYPLLKDGIQKVLGSTVQMVNSAEEVSKEVAQTLETLHLLSPTKEKKDLFYASDDIEGFHILYKRILGESDVTFADAPSEFFSLVQEVYKYQKRLFSDPSSWFEPLQTR